MKLYGFEKSRSFRIVWMFKELNIKYEYTPISPRHDLFSDWFLKINPAGKVPVLVDDNLVLTESAAILTYLGDKFPDSNLVPECGTKQRAVYNQWCYFALSELEQPLWLLHKHRFIFPKKLRVSAIKESALWEFQQQLKILTLGLQNKPWIMGEQFTAADILIGDILGWAQNNNIDFQSPSINNYFNRLSKRSAYQKSRHIETP